MAGVSEFSANELFDGSGIVLPDVADLSSVNLAGLVAPQLQSLVLPKVLQSPNEKGNVERNFDTNGDGFISASELMEKFPNLSLAAIGVMLLTNVFIEKSEGQLESIELLRSTTNKMHEHVIIANTNALKNLREMPRNDNVGTSPAGTAYVRPEKKEWWEWLLGIFIIALTIAIVAIATVFGGPAAGLAAFVGISLLMTLISQTIKLTINAKGGKNLTNADRNALKAAQYLDPAYAAADFLVSIFVELICLGDKENAETHRKRGKIATMAIAMAITIAIAIAAFFIPGGEMYTVKVFSTAANIVNSILAITNSVYDILKAIENLKTAKKVLEYKKLLAFIESQKQMLEILMATIDSMIQKLGDDGNIWAAEFDRISNIIKTESDTKLTIARNIVI